MQSVDPGGGGSQAEHDAGAGGVAEHGITMGVGKKGAAFGKGIDVRGLDHGVPAKAADPVVEVVNGDENDVGFAGFIGGSGGHESE